MTPSDPFGNLQVVPEKLQSEHAESPNRIERSGRILSFPTIRFDSLWPLLLLIVCYMALRSLYWDCQPIWDGSGYSYALLSANKAPFDLLNFTMDEHICQGFFLVMSLPCRLYKHDFFLFNIWLTLFGTLSLIAAYKLLALLSAGSLRGFPLALSAALFAFHPSVLASMIHFTLDLGLLTFALWYWLLLLEKRSLPATIAGVLLILTKETAALILPIILVVTFLWQDRGQRVAWMKKHWPAAVLPFVAFAGMLFYKSSRGHPVFWNQYHDSNPVAAVLAAITPNVMLTNYAGLLFLMNFNWLFFLLWFVLLGLLFRRHRAPGIAPHVRPAILIALLFLSSTGVVFAVRPYSNVRYLMFPIAVMLLGVAHLLMVFIRPNFLRLPALLVLLAALGIEDVRTVDPVSRAFFGTFDFGEHKILSVSARTGECGNLGRDQLVYNLQFLEFPRLIRRMMEDLRPTADTFILTVPSANWLTLPRLDKSTCKPAFGLTHWFSPHYTDVLPDPGATGFQISGRAYTLAELPNSVYFIEFPNVQDRAHLKFLSTRFSRRTDKIYDLDGYQLTLVHFTE